MPKERWKEHPLHKGLKVSNLGRVRSPKGTILKTCSVSKSGHQDVRFPGGRGLVHRLVLETWKGPGKGKVCRHLNGIATDNRLSNLRWGTYADNVRDSKRHGTWAEGTDHANCNLSDRDIRRIRRDDRYQYLIAKDYGVAQSTISRIKSGLRHKCSMER